MGPQIPMSQCLHRAFSVFSNWGLEEDQKGKTRITAVAVGNAQNSFRLSKWKPTSFLFQVQEIWMLGM